MIKLGTKLKRRLSFGNRKHKLESMDHIQRPDADVGLCGATLSLNSGDFIAVDANHVSNAGANSDVFQIELVVDCKECANLYKETFKT